MNEHEVFFNKKFKLKKIFLKLKSRTEYENIKNSVLNVSGIQQKYV